MLDEWDVCVGNVERTSLLHILYICTYYTHIMHMYIYCNSCEKESEFKIYGNIFILLSSSPMYNEENTANSSEIKYIM